MAVAFSLSGLVPTAALHAAPREVQLKPLSKWLVNWEQNSCLVARKFGTARNPVLLSLRSYAPGYTFQFTLAGKAIARLRDDYELSITAGALSPIPIGYPQSGHAEGYGSAMLFSTDLLSAGTDDAQDGDIPSIANITFDRDAFESRLGPITVQSTSNKLTFETGSLAPALRALRACTDDLTKQLGVDPNSQHDLVRGAYAINRKSWASEIRSSYPLRLSRANKGARVIVRIVVDEEGSPSHCDYFQSFTNTDFPVQACNIIMREAKFAPALKKNGQPVSSLYSTVIIYRLN